MSAPLNEKALDVALRAYQKTTCMGLFEAEEKGVAAAITAYLSALPEQTGERWQPIETAPKTPPIGTGASSVCIFGWCPDETAPGGGDQKVVWWEPGYKKWWSDGDMEVRPALWQSLPAPPAGESP
jgi:hypothetical protein